MSPQIQNQILRLQPSRVRYPCIYSAFSAETYSPLLYCIQSGPALWPSADHRVGWDYFFCSWQPLPAYFSDWREGAGELPSSAADFPAAQGGPRASCHFKIVSCDLLLMVVQYACRSKTKSACQLPPSGGCSTIAPWDPVTLSSSE